MSLLIGFIVLGFLIGVYFLIVEIYKTIKKSRKPLKKSPQIIKLEKQIKEIKKKIQQIDDDLEIIPKVEDDVIISMKETLEETKKKLEEELDHLCELYTKQHFNKVYIIYSKNNYKQFSDKMKELYSILAEKHFGNRNVEFITKKALYNKVEEFSNISCCNMWRKKYIDAICLLEDDNYEDGMYIKSYVNILRFDKDGRCLLG